MPGRLQVHSQLHDASTGLRAAVDSHSNEAEGAAAELLCAQRCALELAQAVHQLLELVGQLGVATATAAEAACAAEQRAAWPASMQVRCAMTVCAVVRGVTRLKAPQVHGKAAAHGLPAERYFGPGWPHTR